MELKNRIVMSPMATDYPNDDGTISERLKDYLEARAKGGVGLITLEPTTIGENLPYQPHTVALWDDKFIPGLKDLTAAVHSHGAKIVPQIIHPGPESLSPFFHKIPTVGPSPVMCHTTKQMCREITRGEIDDVVKQFGAAARRAREAGCDGIELHAAHSYMLVGSFLSPLRNHRTDAYGGSIDGRLRFPLQVIASIRAEAGHDFPIILRISGDELMPGGQTLRDTQYLAPILVQAGIDGFHVSSGVFPQMAWRILAPTGTPRGLNVAFAAAIKKVVDVPVMTVGRINDPRFAEDILKRNDADLIVMGRALLADPELPNKAMDGRFEDIAPCIACGLGCSGRKPNTPLTCVVNPTVGREKELAITPAAQAKKVMVVGAGPAGLESARVAALRGHTVELYEKESQVGGQFSLASVPPMKQELTNVPAYLAIQIEKAGCSIHFNTEVTPDFVKEVNPEVVIVATGGAPLVPNIPGIDGEKVVTAHDVLAGRVAMPHGNILVIGGGMVGCEVSEFLANAGDNPVIGRAHITIVEMLKNIGLDMVPEHRTLLLQKLRGDGVQITTSARVKEFVNDGVIIERDGKEESIRGMDYIVLAMGACSYDPLSKQIRDDVSEVYIIGDAGNPCRALEAIAEGSEVGRNI